MTHIELVRNNGFTWYAENNIHVKGFIFDKNGNYLRGNSLIQYFNNITDESTFVDVIKHSNGLFNVIIETGSGVLAAVDIIRTFPLFYYVTPQGIFISDEADVIINSFSKPSLNEINVNEFLSTGYVTGNETLVNGIHQLVSGEYLYFDGVRLNRNFYFTYSINHSFSKNFKELNIEGNNVIANTYKRLIASLDGRMAVIPLSGGYDSRLIATMLKLFNYENVLCFTYGRKNNDEIAISKKVAETLGFKWIFIEYNLSHIDGFINDPVFRSYYKYSANYTSMFFMQEYFAVKYLKENKIISTDSVFIPGHSGDFLGGSQLTKFNVKPLITKKEILDKILQTKFGLVKLNKRFIKLFRNKIMTEIELLFNERSDYLPYSVLEAWDCREKLSKFNANSANLYNFFGYEHRFPFWDLELTDFFKQVQYEYKWEKKLYDQIAKDYFSKYNINFDKELQSSLFVIKRQWFKDKIKSFLPLRIKYLFTNKYDNYYYYEITDFMIREIINDDAKYYRKFAFGNGNIVQWYIYNLKRDVRFDRSLDQH